MTTGRRNRGSHNRGLGNPGPNDLLARAIVAALLNAQAGLTPTLSVAAIKNIWKEYVTLGYFAPTAGVQWGLQDILVYLASTQPA